MHYKIPISLMFIGAILLVASLLLLNFFPSFFDSQLDKKLIISQDSEMIEKFKDPPVPLTFKIWLFNITNPDEILKGDKPSLQEVGPYTYTQKRKKVNIAFDHSAGTVKFNLRKHFSFNPELSEGSEEDLVTTVNLVYMSLASRVWEEATMFGSFIMTWFIRFKSKPFIVRSAKELFFAGYKDQIIQKLYDLTKKSKYETGKFGYFIDKNYTLGQRMEIFTGELGMESYQHLVKLNDMERLNYWKTESCNTIVGTDGSQFPRPVTNRQTITFYSADLCRSVYGVYEKNVSLGPLSLYRFVLPPEMLAKSPENDCYCSSDFSCRQSMIDLSPCKEGSPIVVSTPHFYQGKEEDIQQVKGLKPLKEKHETFLDIEPTTGVTLRVNKRIQVNVAFRRYGIPALSNINEVIMPILWVSEAAEASLSTAEALHSKLTVIHQVVFYGSWSAFFLSLALIAIGLIFCYRTCKKSEEGTVSETNSSNANEKKIDENCE